MTASGVARARSGWWIPLVLVGAVVIPGIAGTFRVIGLAGGPQLIPANPRMTATPTPVVVHIVAALVYAVVGAFQFLPALRQRHPAWHRRAGRVLVPLGLAVAMSAAWMTLGYPQQPGTGSLAWTLRLTFAAGMATCLVLAVAAVRRRDIGAHRAWMTRAYAIALAAGTQTFTLGVAGAIGSGALIHDLGLGAGWVVNLVVAEAILWRAGRRRGPVPHRLRTAGTT